MEILLQDETITYRAGRHSTNCQLFINLVDQDYLTTRSTMGTDQQCECQASSTTASFVLYVSKTQRDPMFWLEVLDWLTSNV